MKKYLVKAGLTGIITLIFSLNVAAQSSERQQERKERPSVEEIFKMMDRNEDAKLSKEEVKGPLKNDFSRIDSNKDGFISKEELEKAPKPKRNDKSKNKR
ncbi:MAG: Ca2+-binding EF-hand superfamily protein [Ulvibacter sp.]|jgi:Ca2+-binding EF-hand superfamily protein